MVGIEKVRVMPLNAAPGKRDRMVRVRDYVTAANGDLLSCFYHPDSGSLFPLL